ncbi:two-component regulator propeller domain-containing protein [Algoriphagus sp. C2-6-M1]|uniref:ligand-binding sensor domain-containing protein n=1 Tax=Algoriphagus persicinus TaxID=3108754 RepID=UPI002B3B9BC5|nr:two-component regulator propeller domain-containing protein [Algoriphagus sp. C2-6-M1]MEB2781670.1 two-component regulator propeller domain-containing protein [Algoriphagus sp. C2-6-M1]
MIKHYSVHTLFLMLAFLTSCGQKQTNVPQDNIKSNNAGYSESQLKEADSSRVPMSMVRNVKQARNGDILVASYLGVFRYDGTSFTNLTSKIISARFASFWDVLEDRKGNLWLASKDSGVYHLPAGETNFQHFTTKDGLASNMVLHIFEDKAGNIWFGPSRYDGKSFKNFTTEDGFPTNNIRLLFEDKTGKLWFGPHLENMFVYDPGLNGDLDSYRDGQGKGFTVLKNKDGKAFNNVWSIIEDKKGNIWFGDLYGLWRYDPSASLSAEGNAFTHVSERGAYSIIQDKKGNIWTTGEVKLYGNVWALSRYDAESLYNEKPTVTEIMSQTGMLLGILEDAKGNIWFGSGGGLYRYDGNTITDFKSAAGH